MIVGTAAVAEVLPEAVSAAREQRPAAAQVAMEPVVTETMRRVVRREPDLFAELLAPTIGRAVRKAVKDAMAALLQRFNEALERSLSVTSLRWRIEARRTGVPFAEVVLAHTLVYRVEQVFLLHAPTGLVLQHVVAEGIRSAAPDQVAAMLAALDAFARDALKATSAGARLEEVSVGDVTLWIDWDPTIAVAAVVRGSGPRSLVALLQETRERIGLEQRALLRTVVVDPAPFVTTRPILERCLHQHSRPAPRRAQVILALAALVVAAAVVASLVGGRLAEARAERLLAAYRASLAAEPGIVVTSAKREDGRYRVAGLRDPLAAEPADVLARRGHPSAELAFAPFQSLHPRMVEERARRTLRPPPGVSLTLSRGTLRLAGEAPRAWKDRALTIAPVLAGVTEVDPAGLRSSEGLAELRAASAALEAVTIRYPAGSAEPAASERAALHRAVSLGRRISALSAEEAMASCITAVGHTDVSGTEAENAALAGRRAAAAVASLREGGADPAGLRQGTGELTGRGPEGRQVRFDVEIRPGGLGECQEGLSE